MAYQALYRTYRPNTFDEVIGQKYIVKTLKNAIENNKIAHAYLFCGPRGTGKTTIARILAKAINCENETNRPCNECLSCRMIMEGTHPDIIEIDGASYGTVDSTRELIDKVKYAPLQGKYKVYIIDEVHMLSISAFNSLLKTLEEPPAHAVFILATTDPQKVLPTIISRCQRYDFEKVSKEDIYNRLKYVLDNEKIAYEEDALQEIAFLADGGLRDALSILDQVIAYSPETISLDAVYKIYGIASKRSRYNLLDAIANKDTTEALSLSNKLEQTGIKIERFTYDLIEVIKQCVIYEQTRDKKYLKDLEEKDALSLLQRVSDSVLLTWIDDLLDAYKMMHNQSTNTYSIFEIALLKMIQVVHGTNNVQPTPVVQEKTQEPVKREKPPVVEVKKEPEPEVVPVKEEPVKEEEIKPEETNKTEAETFDDEYLLGLLVGANKLRKAEMLQAWPNLNEYSFQEDFAKYVSSLRECQPAACGTNYAIITTKHTSVCEQVNEDRMSPRFRELFKNLCGSECFIFAITNDRFASLVKLFKERSAQRTLPSPVVIKMDEEKKETETEKKLNELFGEGNYNLMGE
ncbi:MAG: DNA polymerase III subunit gamma/tau [Solobacterium sp.]|nr:DNA polymerase III subunit gamma/tau [Solobacterium sp.]